MSVPEWRDATPEDLELLRSWQRQPHVAAAGENEQWHWESASCGANRAGVNS